MTAKVMLIAFFDYQGLLYQHICPLKTKVASQYYLKVLQKLKKHIRHKRVDIQHNWNLHQDNTRLQVATLVTACLESQNMDTVVHPPYSPDIIPRNFWLFPSLEKALHGWRFQSDQKVVTITQMFFNSLSKEESSQTIIVK